MVRLVLALRLVMILAGAAIAMPVMAQAPSAAPAEAARMAIALQIVQNLRLYNILAFVAKAELTKDDGFMSLPQGDRDRVYALVNAEMNLRRTAIESKLATASAGAYTAGQLKDVLTIARLKFMQDRLMSGVNPNLPRPEETDMNSADKATYDAYSRKPHVVDFFEKLQLGPASEDMSAAVSAAYQRYSAEAAKEKQ